MIIWSGLGFLVVVIAFGCALVVNLLTNAMFHDDRYYESHQWPLGVGLLVASVMIWFLGRGLNADAGRRLIDPDTNRKYKLRSNHTLFFIPMQYWGPILMLLGFVFLFTEKS